MPHKVKWSDFWANDTERETLIQTTTESESSNGPAINREGGHRLSTRARWRQQNDDDDNDWAILGYNSNDDQNDVRQEQQAQEVRVNLTSCRSSFKQRR